MPTFRYPCPGCRTENSLHDPGCEFEGTDWPAIEKAYTDLLAVLTAEPDGIAEPPLRAAIPGDWSPLHAAALGTLRRTGRVTEVGGGGGGSGSGSGSGGDGGGDAGDAARLRLLTAAEYKEFVSEPTREPMRTIYEHGSVPGCHDNAVFAMIAWYEMVGLSWAETKENVVEWLESSGAWARGGFEESSPAELVEGKRHVYEAGYGWKEKAQAAKRVIDRRR